MAIIKANATCGPATTTDDIGTLITKPDITKLSTSVKDEAIKVEGMIGKACEALEVNRKESVVDMG